MERRQLPQHAGQVGGRPAAPQSRRVEEIAVIRLDHERRRGEAREVGQLLVQGLQRAHVAEQVVEALPLHHRPQALPREQPVVADGKLAACDVGPGKAPRIPLGRVDHDRQRGRGRAQLQPAARAMGPNGGLGPEEHLLVPPASVPPRLFDRQKLAALAARAVQHHDEFPAHPRQMGDRRPFHRLERLRRVELPLRETEDLLSGTGPRRLGADGQHQPTLLLDRHAEGETAAVRALDQPDGGHEPNVRRRPGSATTAAALREGLDYVTGWVLKEVLGLLRVSWVLADSVETDRWRDRLTLASWIHPTCVDPMSSNWLIRTTPSGKRAMISNSPPMAWI